MSFPFIHIAKTQMRRILSLISLLLMLTITIPLPAQAAESRSISQVLEQYSQGWEQGDIAALKSLWDTTDAKATYMPVESSDIIQGLSAIDRYYEQVIPAFDVIKLDVINPTIDQLGDIAYVAANSDIVFQSSDGSMSEFQPRLSFVLKRSGARWSLIHYAEVTRLNFE